MKLVWRILIYNFYKTVHHNNGLLLDMEGKTPMNQEKNLEKRTKANEDNKVIAP